MTTRSEARALWQRVAEGELEDVSADGFDLHAWVREAARALLVADDEPQPLARRAAIVRAVGLHGHLDGYAQLRALVHDARWDFSEVTADGEVRERRRGEIIRAIVEEARARGILRGIYADDDKKAADVVRELLPK